MNRTTILNSNFRSTNKKMLKKVSIWTPEKTGLHTRDLQNKSIIMDWHHNHNKQREEEEQFTLQTNLVRMEVLQENDLLLLFLILSRNETLVNVNAIQDQNW